MEKKRRVLVFGGRDFDNRRVIFRFLDKYHSKYEFDELVHGAANGVDSIAGEWGKTNGLRVRECPAAWNDLTVEKCVVKEGAHGKYNVLAGLNRNEEMFEKYKPQYVVEFPGGTGTQHMHNIVCTGIALGYDVKHITVFKRLQNARSRKT